MDTVCCLRHTSSRDPKYTTANHPVMEIPFRDKERMPLTVLQTLELNETISNVLGPLSAPGHDRDTSGEHT